MAPRARHDLGVRVGFHPEDGHRIQPQTSRPHRVSLMVERCSGRGSVGLLVWRAEDPVVGSMRLIAIFAVFSYLCIVRIMFDKAAAVASVDAQGGRARCML